MPSLQTVSSSTNSNDSHVNQVTEDEDNGHIPAPAPVPATTRLTAVGVWLDDVIPGDPEVSSAELWRQAIDEELA